MSNDIDCDLNFKFEQIAKKQLEMEMKIDNLINVDSQISDLKEILKNIKKDNLDGYADLAERIQATQEFISYTSKKIDENIIRRTIPIDFRDFHNKFTNDIEKYPVFLQKIIDDGYISNGHIILSCKGKVKSYEWIQEYIPLLKKYTHYEIKINK